MRTYGRITNEDGTKTWVVVVTDSNGFNDAVWVTTLCQCLRLSPNESPFYSQYGIPAQNSVIQQFFPDYYVYQTQQQFSSRFASLIITRVASTQPTAAQAPNTAPAPTYRVDIVTTYGSKIAVEIPQ